MSVSIFSVTKESPAERAGIKSGEALVSINGNVICDVLDYRFWQLESRLELVISGIEGERCVKIKKDEYEELGLEFETYLMDKQHSCKNKCIFCFVDQLPRGMRQSLYFKDDDTRLSFLFGNYVTLTNISRHEIDRIIKMHISPINVSVHTTNPDLRVKMMANPDAARALSILKEFADAGISINCQLVLCPGINDGDELKRSLADLSALMPAIESIALVPVGLTKHREKLFPLVPYCEKTAREVIKIADEFGEKLLKAHGTRLVYCSDEFYLKANLPLPDISYYEDFAQLDNGVGLIVNMQDEIDYLIEDEEPNQTALAISVATGVDAAPFVEAELKKLQSVFKGLKFTVHPIQNDFFGHTITVAGLVTAGDIIAQLKEKSLGEFLIVPDVMLRHEKDRFLDDLTIDDVKNALGVEVLVSGASGEGLYNCIKDIIMNIKEG